MGKRMDLFCTRCSKSTSLFFKTSFAILLKREVKMVISNNFVQHSNICNFNLINKIFLK